MTIITQLQNLNDDLTKIINFMNTNIKDNEHIKFSLTMLEGLHADMRDLALNVKHENATTKGAIEEIKQLLREEIKRQEEWFGYDDHSGTVEDLLGKVEEIEKKWNE